MISAVPGATLDVVGGASQGLAATPLPPTVTIRGHVDDLPSAYAEADIALALVRDGSGVKMKLLEAVAYGVPAAATEAALRGLPGPAAEVFPIVDAEAALVALLSECAADAGRLDALAAAQSGWAREHLDPDKLVADLLNVIREA